MRHMLTGVLIAAQCVAFAPPPMRVPAPRAVALHAQKSRLLRVVAAPPAGVKAATAWARRRAEDGSARKALTAAAGAATALYGFARPALAYFRTERKSCPTLLALLWPSRGRRMLQKVIGGGLRLSKFATQERGAGAPTRDDASSPTPHESSSKTVLVRSKSPRCPQILRPRRGEPALEDFQAGGRRHVRLPAARRRAE